MLGISVIVCTYNPEKAIFERVLTAIKESKKSGLGNFECIIVDNNSLVSLNDVDYIQNIISEIPNCRVVIERNQGLTSARIRGIKESGNEYLIFIDDDNEIDNDYFVNVSSIINSYPIIAAFNAGVIRVEYIGPVSKWFLERGKVHFQESNLSSFIWGNSCESYRHWPFGTGLVATREVCNLYLNKVESGEYSLTDRMGAILTSGGDGQLISCAVKLNYGIGRSPELKLNHLIASRKATIKYICRVDYGISFSNELFIKECFPDQLTSISWFRELRKLLKLFTITFFKEAILKRNRNSFLIQKATLLGMLNGNRHVNGKEKSIPLQKLAQNIIG